MSISHDDLLKLGRYDRLSLDDVDPSLARGLHFFMVRLRRCQEEIIRVYHPADEIRCPVHFCIGQEAMPAALSPLVQENDYLFSHHRSHGYFLAKGGTLRQLFAELYGKATGANGGLAGSQEISLPGQRFFSGAIISGMLATAVGAGLGIRMQGVPGIAIAVLGDGATDEGVFWEAVNLAVLHKLPVLFLCENNKYSTYSPQWKRQVADNIHVRVHAFGMSVQAIFGNDVTEAHRVLTNAMRDVREGKGPFFVEAYTYRWQGHVGPEDDDYIGYRSLAERGFWKRNCPIALLEEKMQQAGLLSEEEHDEGLREIDREIAEAFTFAKESPAPSVRAWEKLNYCLETPLADKLLQDEPGQATFDHNQKYATPGPY